MDAALDAVREFDGPAAVVVKHTNPCGVAVARSLAEAYRAAREADALSAFGGIVALNGPVDEETAKVIGETFVECVVAPSFAPAALEVLRAKKNLRLLATGGWLAPDHAALTSKRVGGGERGAVTGDATAAGEDHAMAASRRPAGANGRRAYAALEFAWRAPQAREVRTRSCSQAAG